MKITFVIKKQYDGSRVFYRMFERIIGNENIEILLLPCYNDVVLQILSENRDSYTSFVRWVKPYGDMKPEEYRKLAKFIKSFVEMSK